MNYQCPFCGQAFDNFEDYTFHPIFCNKEANADPLIARNLRNIDPPCCDNCHHLRRVRGDERKCKLTGGFEGSSERAEHYICDMWFRG